MSDNGPAMVAKEVCEGLSRLGILHETTLPYSPAQYVAEQFMFCPLATGRDLQDQHAALRNITF
jgi:hypothetical protein